ncbi:redoxin domain-containing protein [Thiobacillus denitrificans]|uniref:redoxin domain-containing protein n=1 Tax=Thiobacillus denitrificans TaxID=36861 RepID=UPI000369E36E|nr:redoxin domain-containing protein [Thiobacillus denitrificans]
MISIGHAVPDVSCEACLSDGRIETVSLAHYRGKWLVLFFWPLDFTFICPTEIRAYSDLGHEFDISGAVLLGASVDSARPTIHFGQQTGNARQRYVGTAAPGISVAWAHRATPAACGTCRASKYDFPNPERRQHAIPIIRAGQRHLARFFGLAGTRPDCVRARAKRIRQHP